jgi:hypothetical protein
MRMPLISEKAVQYELLKLKSLAQTRDKPNYLDTFLAEWLVTYRLLRRTGHLLTGKMSISGYKNLNRNPLTESQHGHQKASYIFPRNPKISTPHGVENELVSEKLNHAACESLSESPVDAKAEYQLNLPYFIESLSEAKDLCRSNHIDFYLVYVPAKPEVYSDILCKTLQDPEQGIIQRKMFTLHDNIMAICDSLNIQIIDLLPEFIESTKQGEQLYYNSDDHLHPNGHRVWAEVVNKHLKEDQ